MKLQPLYSKSANGSTLIWSASVEGNTVTVEYGQLGGKMQRRETVCTGKNIGRANETSPEDQANLEAASKWFRQRDRKGYVLTLDADSGHSIRPFCKPMLALAVGKRKSSLPKQVVIQPKLNGHRALAMKDDAGQVRMWSRGLKEIATMGHIIKDLQEYLQEGMLVDGELYLHNTSLQRITSLIKREQTDSSSVRFHVFDAVCRDNPDSVFTQRTACIPYLGENVKIVDSIIIPSTQVADYAYAFLAQGYEGAIVRTDEGGYRAGYRSPSVLKVKQFHDDEFIVRDITKGIPHNGMDVAILHFDTFKCTGPGTREFKDYVANNPGDYIGRKVTVQYAELTQKGVPFHPVALGFREEL